MLEISKNANPNYLCKIVQLKNLKKHSNADRLQTVDIDFQTVITGMDAKEGDIYVYFPLECKINIDYLVANGSLRPKDAKEGEQEQKGFFERNGRVKAMKLRGEKSMGYICPAETLETVIGYNIYKTGIVDMVGQEFDTINGVKLVEKYEVKKRVGSMSKQGKKPKLSRLVDGQIHLHADTENLRRNSHKINPDDNITITYKTHGTSWWVSNVLVKRKLSLLEKAAKFCGINITETEYDLVYGSRKVVKNSDMKDPKARNDFFGYDLWEKVKDEVGEFIPKGFTLYGEMLGYTHNGGSIQEGFYYGCDKGEHRLEVYRITNTTPDGLVTELSYNEIKEFCDRVGLNASYLFYQGKAGGWHHARRPFNEEDLDNWREEFIVNLEKKYNEKDCFMCGEGVPEEGVVIRKEKLFSFEAYKLKSFRFLEKESKFLDKGVSDIESEN